jgi:hypothetical protein
LYTGTWYPEANVGELIPLHEESYGSWRKFAIASCNSFGDFERFVLVAAVSAACCKCRAVYLSFGPIGQNFTSSVTKVCA